MEKNEELKKQALKYHASGRPGKLEITPTKPSITAFDLSLAYSPGVAFPCLEIARQPDDAFKYTAKGNLVGVVSNGSAVLGLGNIGPLASKPVMEGKGMLFKKFADIDVFDIEVNETEIERLVQVVKALEPTFGGINLEDIKAPECFEIERRLQEIMNIPVFHDDQHGTAIIASAAFLNALEVTKRKIEKVQVVFSGAGAASIATARLFLELGVKPEHLIMTDSKGVIYQGRSEGMNPYKDEFANPTNKRTLADAMKGADAFIGCSAKGVLTPEMVKSMAKKPIIFAMANPDPEILPHEVQAVRDDAIMATGRSDYPNQVNNVLGFPFIFRGALDVKARKINEEMKMAAVRALASLAKEPVPDEVKGAYDGADFEFGPQYLIPKPFDQRALTRVAPAVAKAAIDSGVAREPISNLDEYAQNLERRLGSGAAFIKALRDRLNRQKKSVIVFPEGVNTRILYSVSIILQEGRITPILIGDTQKIHQRMDKLGLEHLKGQVEIVTPETDARLEDFYYKIHDQRKRKGVTLSYAEELMHRHNYFAAMMVKEGHADGMVTGTTQNYPDCVKPILRVIGVNPAFKAAGIIILVFKNKILFLADCTMNTNPNSKELCSIAMATVDLYRRVMLREPNMAFVSYSNFGSVYSDSPNKMAEAVRMTKRIAPQLAVDGEMQADVAVNNTIRKNLFDFSTLDGEADILIFPNLDAANISYKLLAQLGGAMPIGPLLVPTNMPANIVQRTSTVSEIVNMTTITALMAQAKEKPNAK